MKILVTGGAGFIGSNFLRMLHSKGLTKTASIIVLDLFTYAGLESNLDYVKGFDYTLVKGDVCDRDLIQDLVKSVDLIVHFAAESHVDRSILSPDQFVLTNILGTQTILEGVRTNPYVRLIHISTDEVYGSIEIGFWDENSPLQPRSPYSASKAAADLLCLSYINTYNLDICITRSCNNFGPNQMPDKLIPLFVTNLLEGKKLPLFGNGENIREWIYVDDNCEAIWNVAMNGKTGQIYNIGSGYEVSNLKLTRMLTSYFGQSDEVIEFIPDRAGHDFRYSLDISKIKKELIWIPNFNFEKKLYSTIEWYRENNEWWEPLKR